MHPLVSEQLARLMTEDRIREATRARLARVAADAAPRTGIRLWAGVRLIGLGRRLAGPAGAAR